MVSIYYIPIFFQTIKHIDKEKNFIDKQYIICHESEGKKTQSGMGYHR
jgi:hypothetical protein